MDGARNGPGNALALDQQLCFALYSASLAMTKVYKPLLDSLGLTYPQYLVMLVLWEGSSVGAGRMTVSALGTRLHLDSGTLTPLLKRLETNGLLSRRRDSGDERRVLVELTPAGRALKKQARGVPAIVFDATACGVDELSGLTRQLHHLRNGLHTAAASRTSARRQRGASFTQPTPL